MAEIIPMPDLGFEADEGELSVWLKDVGDAVQAGEPIAEFESDKVTLEVETPVAGVLLEHLIQPGESVAEGAPIARIGEAEELSVSPASAPSPAKEPARPPPEPPAAKTPSTPLPAAPQESEPVSRVPAAPAGNGLLATPIALRMAASTIWICDVWPAAVPGGGFCGGTSRIIWPRPVPGRSRRSCGARQTTATGLHRLGLPLRRCGGRSRGA